MKFVEINSIFLFSEQNANDLHKLTTIQRAVVYLAKKKCVKNAQHHGSMRILHYQLRQ